MLGGFDWNLTEPTWFTLRVHEVLSDRLVHYHFPGPEGFICQFRGEEERSGREIWSCPFVNVEAVILDHKLPVLAFRINERPPFSLSQRRMDSLGLVAGEWIRELKRRAWRGEGEGTIVVSRRIGDQVVTQPENDPALLYRSIQGDSRNASIGYVTDVGWTENNVASLVEAFRNLTLLCGESTFLHADEEKARASYHLTTRDLSRLIEQITPSYLLPMHLSKSYLHRSFDLYEEIQLPPQTSLLRLPSHLVPAPLMTEAVERLLWPARSAGQHGGG
jgi:ribonuclease Z